MAKSNSKQYRNVYTILEKVKKGELVSTGPSLFSKVDYRKRAEVVKPYLHYIDENALKRSVQHYVSQPASHNKLQQLAKAHNKKLVSPDSLSQEMTKIWNSFPKEVINDIFNLYYNQVEKLQFEDRGPHNKMRFSFLEKANNPVTKVITQGSNLKSMVFTRNMVQYFLMMLAMMQQQDPEQFKKMMDELNQKPPSGGQGQPQQGQGGSGNGGQQEQQQQQPQDSAGNGQQDQQQGSGQQQQPQQGPPQGNQQQSGSQAGKSGDFQESPVQKQLEKMMQDMVNSSLGQKMMDQVIQDAKDTVKMMEGMMTEEEMKDMWDSLGTGGPADELDKTDKERLSQLERELKQIKLNMTGVKDKIRKLLDNSLSFFNGKEDPFYEGIFDADSLAGLQDYDLLHPCLRKFMIEDVLIKDVKRIGKIDIFVDVSGSMGSGCGVKDASGRSVSKLTFAKALALKMKEMDLLSDVYTFQTSVKKKKSNSLYDIMTIDGGGGTDIDKVVERIIHNRKNAIVLTDAEDNCSHYSEHAYFIGVAGARFTSFHPTALQQYAERGQMIVFDGTRVQRVNEHGNTY